ncbi:MAG: M42 family metallopeptidase [Candidatus Zixiibacteriota bacterium]|nr:MAG: M42 family metallopeptidase [candidate division Zixibacteria bacterium]
MDKTELLLKEITELNGVSGYESEVRKLMVREMKNTTDKIEYDKLGSVLGTKRGTSDSPRIMVIGHMDEIGFMVKEVTKEGYIKFLPLGGWWGHVALGQRMRVIGSKGAFVGVVGSKPPHLLPMEDRKKVLEIKDMFIDVGVQEKVNITKKLGIKPGDPIVPDSQFTILGNNKMYMSKAFDNRASCAIVLDLLRRLARVKHPNTVLGGGTVQEEVGLRGAQTIAHLADPDVCFTVDIGVGRDVPPDGFSVSEKLGSGVTIVIYDAGMIPNLKLRDLFVKTAEEKKIPYHLSYMERGTGDGARVHVSRLGVPSIYVGPPVRYIHSHNGIMNRADYDNTIRLFVEVIKKLDKKTVKSLTEG